MNSLATKVLSSCQLINTEEGNVEVHWGNVIASCSLMLVIVGACYSVIMKPVHSQLERHETHLIALEISDARTGVHLENLTKAIDKLITKLDDSHRGS